MTSNPVREGDDVVRTPGCPSLPCSSRPRRVRPRKWNIAEIEAVHELRARYPTWGKAKLQVLLTAEGTFYSVSKVGRILGYLRQRCHLPVPVRRSFARERQAPRPNAVRNPQTTRWSSPETSSSSIPWTCAP